MTGHPRLYRRGATYYHRAAVPIDIKDSYPKTEEVSSLRTKDRAEAMRLVRIEAARVDALFESHRLGLHRKKNPPVKELTAEQMAQAAELYYASMLAEDDDVREGGFFDPDDDELPELPVPTFEEYEEEIDEWDMNARHYHARGKVDSFYLAEAEDWIGGMGIEIDPDSPSIRQLARKLQAGYIKANEIRRARNKGDIIETPEFPDSQPVSNNNLPLLSQASKEWIAEKSRGAWRPKIEREHTIWMGHFLEVIGDKPISDYSKADGRAFKAILTALPANWVKHPALKSLTIQEAAEKARESNMTPMSDTNANKLMGFIGSFWTWGEANYDDCTPSPFKGLKVKNKRNIRDERLPFTVNELNTIFKTPIYTGCKSQSSWKDPGSLIPNDKGIYWIPLIGLFTGARAGEIIQLHVNDVREQDGILYLDMNTDSDDKTLKTAGSKRKIPVHPTLIELGFLKHVEKMRKAKNDRLFPEIKKGNDGYWSSPFSKHFSRFLTVHKLKHNKISFHSFRHNFEDACREGGVSKDVMDAIQGHVETGMSGRYGSGHSLKVLNENMKKISYAGLDLAHLM
ncbi:site-specific integrase [Aestuariispira insulae]|uniref:Phage integrase family protein n=1 Tax=Aestuariispira insulae TaxID=1461337 RepID=A0A3D9HVF6_9PROT|nr:site-specific integrase [Aestuariispira insulae]RED53493.1 phage integrase family protein [Aestuariispira insulae]